MPQLAQMLQVAAPQGRTVRLRSRPVTAAFAGLQYRVWYVAEHMPNSFGRPASFLDVVLSRTAPAASGTASQSNQYSFQPDKPFSFTWKHGTLSKAHLDTAHAIAPDALAATFSATSDAVDVACPGESGGTAHIKRAVGEISYSAFSIDTDASPFFGTLLDGPAKGRLEVDQGCASSVRPRPRQCLGRQELTAFRSDQFWTFDSRYGDATRRQGHLDFGSFLASPVRIRFMESPVPLAAFPRAMHSSNGAVAHVTAAGNPFMSGSATFRSTKTPQTSGLHSCLSHGRAHRFRLLQYDGRLTPDATRLTANYDTGAGVLRAADADLLLRVYVS
ncbi:MAG: hypothetical protein QOJ13_3633 [Gaiellales bacterium]|nr:hypothetical protein [Gaiellales bacterium]